MTFIFNLELKTMKGNEIYRELFKYQIDDELIEQIRTVSNSGYVLGIERFQQQIAQTLG